MISKSDKAFAMLIFYVLTKCDDKVEIDETRMERNQLFRLSPLD